MTTVYKRELKSLFCGATGWIFVACAVLANGLSMLYYNLLSGYSSMQQNLSYACLFYLAATPLITMDAFARERRLGVDRLLNALPIRPTEMVAGKYFAYLTLLLIGTALCCAMPFALLPFGGADVAGSINMLLGFFALGAPLLALGVLIAALVPARLPSFALCLACMLALRYAPDKIDFFARFSPFSLISGFASGVTDIRALVYFATASAALVALAGWIACMPGCGIRRHQA